MKKYKKKKKFPIINVIVRNTCTYNVSNSSTGILSKVTELDVELHFNCSSPEYISIEWEPPSTLDIPQSLTDIVYLINVTYMGDTNNLPDVSHSRIRKKVQNINSQTDNCEQFFVTVIPSNDVGLGPPSTFTASRISQGLLNNLVILG